MKKVSLAVGSVIIFSFLIAVPIAFSSVINGLVLAILWKWFMVPVFSLPELSPAPAMGICLIIVFLTRPIVKEERGKKKKDESEKDDKNGTSISEGLRRDIMPIFFRSLAVLLIGYIVQIFM